jgi:superfamily I DNA and RNA helicase
MNSYYFEKLAPQVERSELLNQIQEYSNQNKIQVYVLTSPLLKDRLDEVKDIGYVVLIPKRRILFIQCTDDDDAFADYFEDTKEDIAFLSKKFEIETIIGRIRNLKTHFITKKESDIKSFKDLVNKELLIDQKEWRRIDIIISLFIGCINESEKITLDEPENLLDKIKYKIQLFDTDQTRFIYEELKQKVIRIQGLAGTGKTELLLHKLKELYITDPDSKIAITCHNKVLANSLRTRIPQFFDSMKVEKQIEWDVRLWCFNAWGRYSFPNSGLLRLICHKYELPFFSYKEAGDFETACKLVTKQLKVKYKGEDIPPILDYIFVDESQDFEDAFFNLCILVAKKRIYLAGDIFQSIFEDRRVDKLNTDFLLSRCYRTDPKTLMFAQGLGMGLFEDKKLYWLDKEQWEFCGYSVKENIQDGTYTLTREPIRRFEDLSPDYNSLVIEESGEITKYIVQQINNLRIEYPDLKPSDLCIIFIDNEDYVYTFDSKLGNEISKSTGWDYVLAHETKKVDSNCIVITNRNNIKGLEFPFIFCITRKLIPEHSYRNAIYTMLSRSFLRSYLIIAKQAGNGLTEEMKSGAHHIMVHKNMVIKVPTPNEIEQIKQDFKVLHKSKSLRDRIEDSMFRQKIDMNFLDKIIDTIQGFERKDWTEEQLDDCIRNCSKYLS